MRKNIMISLIVLGLLFNINIISAAENSVQYDLNTIQDRLIKESLEVKKIEADEKLINVKYEKTIDDYLGGKTTYFSQKTEMGVDKAYEMLKKYDFKDEMKGIYSDAKLNYKYGLSGVSSTVAQIKNYEPLIFKRSQAANNKNSEILKSKFNIQQDYYNLLVASKEIDLLEKDISNLKKQIETEKLKTDYGVSTGISVDELSNKLITTVNKLKVSKNNIDLLKEKLKTRLNLKVEDDLSLKFNLPEKKAELSINLNDIIGNMKEKNIELKMLKNNTKVNNDVYEKYKSAYKKNNEYEITSADLDKKDKEQLETCQLELSIAQNDEITLARNLETYVKKVHYEYEKSIRNLRMSNDNLKLLKDKEKILGLNYQQGMVSQLQYDLQKQEIERKSFEADKALITYENARQKLDLANQGIMIK